jgi:hypothetical protein
MNARYIALAVIIFGSATIHYDAMAQGRRTFQIKSLGDEKGRCIEANMGSLKLRPCENSAVQRIDIGNAAPTQLRFHLNGDACVHIKSPENFVIVRSCVDDTPKWSFGFSETRIEKAELPDLMSGLCLDVEDPGGAVVSVVLAACSDSPTQKWQLENAPEPR